jgi:hypothetical protein
MATVETEKDATELIAASGCAATEHTLELIRYMAADSSNNSVITEYTETTAVLCFEHYDVNGRPTRGLLQSIGQMARYYVKLARKLIIVSFAMLLNMLTWSTPLELAACLHLANAHMHRDLYIYYCESKHCRVSAVNASSAQEIGTNALALLILSLSIIDWHVPRCCRSQQMLCRILTAMCMQALRMDRACTAMAFLLPTFGKRPQDQGDTLRTHATATRPATEQTPGTPADAEATTQDLGNAPLLRCSRSAAEPDAATEHIAPASLGEAREASPGSRDVTIKSLADAVSKLASECDESAVALCNAVRTLQRGVQAEIRNLCKPWGVQLTTKTTMVNITSAVTTSSKASLQQHL